MAELIGLGDGLATVIGWGKGAGKAGEGDGETMLHMSLYKQVPSLKDPGPKLSSQHRMTTPEMVS